MCHDSCKVFGYDGHGFTGEGGYHAHARKGLGSE